MNGKTFFERLRLIGARKTLRPAQDRRVLWPIGLLIVVQIVCTVIFLNDVASDVAPQGWSALHNPANLSEFAASIGLILGLCFEVLVFYRLLHRQERMQHSLTAASGELAALMEAHFRAWSLTPTEADVAAFTIKGCSIAEIAGLRGSAEGTVKTHLNAIYRKSGTSGRAQLVSVLVDDLFRGALVARETARAPAVRAAAHPEQGRSLQGDGLM